MARPISEPGERHILAPAQLDNLGEALLALTSEVWALKDRAMVLEAVLQRHGLDLAAEIDAFEPSPELEARMESQRDALIGRIVAALKGG